MINKPSSLNDATETVQTHNGIGNNVQNNLTVQSSITETQLLPQVESGLTEIRHRQFTEAKSIIDTIRRTPELTFEALQLIDILEALYDQAATSEGKRLCYAEAQKHLQRSTQNESQDIAASLLIRVDVLNDNIPEALDRCKSPDQLRSYSAEAFFELLATEDECINAWKTQRGLLEDIQVCGLFRGFLRLKLFSQLTEVAKYLDDYYPSKNSTVFCLIAKTAVWELSLKNRHYWQSNAIQYSEAHLLAEEWTSLLKKTKDSDTRVVTYSINLLNYLFGDNDKLINVCWENVVTVEKIDTKVADNLRRFFEKKPQINDEFLQQIQQAKTSPKYKEELLSEIIVKDILAPEDAALLTTIGSKDHIRKWQELNKSIEDNDPLSRDVRLLELQVIAAHDDRRSQHQLRKYVDTFILKYKSELNQIYPHILTPIADQLIDLDLAGSAVKLMSSLIPNDSLWESPLVRTYIVALSLSQQTKSVLSVLDRIGLENRSDFYWYHKAKAHQQTKDYSGALASIREAIIINTDKPSYWMELLHYVAVSQDTPHQLSEEFKQVPKHLISMKTPNGLRLIHTGIECGNAEDVLCIVLSEFVEAPEKYIQELTNLYSLFLMGKFTADFRKVSIENVVDSVVYQQGENTYKKLIVTSPIITSEFLIDASLPLAETLLNLQPGDEAVVNFQPIRLIERTCPIVQVFQSTANYRTLNNDGNDPFYMVNLPVEPEDMLKTFLQLIPDIPDSEQNTFENSETPFYMKVNWSHRNNPVKGSIYHFLNSRSAKPPIHSFGQVTSTSIILDIHTIIYLGITNLYQSPLLDDKAFFITPDTQALLEQWLSDVNDPDLFMVGKNQFGGFVKTTAKDVQRYLGEIIYAVETILSRCESLPPTIADTPLEMLQIEDLIDASVFTSMISSCSTGIPWLCFDPIIAALHNSHAGECFNMYDLVSTASGLLPFKVRKNGIQAHLAKNIPFHITFGDLTSLSRSGTDEDIWFLSVFLQRYPDCFKNIPDSLHFLSELISLVILSPEASSISIQKCFNLTLRAAIRLPIYDTAEKRFIEIFYLLYQNFLTEKEILKSIYSYASIFAQGHFLDIQYMNELLIEAKRAGSTTTE